MKKILTSVLLSIFISLFVVNHVIAQEEASAPLGVIEIFGCNFKDGKDMDDLNAISRRWNAWADSHNMTDYTALTLVPIYYSEDISYDVLWLGAWPDGAAMGADTVVWINEGQELMDAFNKVLDCGAVMQLTSLNIRPPTGSPEPGTLADFTDCKVHEGRTSQEAIAAIREWSQYLADNGLDLPHWINYPVAGASADANYDFKLSTGFSSAVVYGKFLDFYTSQGYRKAGELFGRLLECNSARVYVMNPVRVAAGE